MILSLLLKKALPFALTFVVGTALGNLIWLFGGSEKKAETVVVTRTYEFGSRCRMRGHNLVAETKPLAFFSVPDAWLPRGTASADKVGRIATVRVTFGADGKVQDVRPLKSTPDARDESLIEVKESWEAAERAARGIRFTPELVNSVPVTVTKDVEIRFTTY